MKETRGRKRSRVKVYPAHIDPAKVPRGCYWDARGAGRWWTPTEINGKRGSARIGGADTKLSDLHKIMEQRAGLDTDNLIFLGKKFKESVQYSQVALKTRKDWDYCARVVESHPSKKPGLTMGKAALSQWTPVVVQKLVDQIAAVNGPSTAKHVFRYLRRIFNWGVTRGYLALSPVRGKFEFAKERERRRMPERATVSALVAFAQERGALKPHTKGSCPAYIWKTLVIAYKCRLRGVEVFDQSDDQVLEEGLRCARRKGSSTNITRWDAELRAAVESAKSERTERWAKLKKPVPMLPKDRPLLVGVQGQRITQNAWQNAWADFMDLAVAEKVITSEQRFGLHDIKRRGATDTKGTKAQKMDATGHKTRSELDKYDFEEQIVDAAGE